MKHPPLLLLLLAAVTLLPRSVDAQFRTLETDDMRLVYLGAASDYLVGHVARSYTNSLGVYKEMFDYRPSDPVTLFLHDGSDYGNAGADVLPNNFISMGMAPLHYAFETAPANERINSTLHHELVHILANDKAAGRDRFFRSLFGGKVAVDQRDPLTILYSYATAPRRYAPRWYQEGVATFMETWMSGGLGRSLGGYDEMVFRTKVLEGGRFYDMIGLESEGTTVDFQLGVNSYLYGTRFMSYLAYTYGPQKVQDWINRPPGSRGHFTAQFKSVFGTDIGSGWRNWIAFERDFQQKNLETIRTRPVTDYRSLASRPLGSISRAFIDRETNRLITAANYPGTLPHIAAIDLETGEMERVTYVRGPMLFSVSSLAFDPANRLVFYTSDNNQWRDLRVVDLATGKDRLLIEDTRAGDLAFNRADNSVWGVRHDLGLSTIVRMPEPYTDWEHVCIFDYGTDVYDLDVSPDGQWVTAAKAEVDGTQSLIRMPAERCGSDGPDLEVLVHFDVANPESFVFSDDGLTLYGSSYYSGVSNIYRYDIEADQLVALTNAESGFFRPQPVDGDSLVAFVFTDRGFSPVMLPDQAVQATNVRFLGQEVVERHPVVTTWVAPPPSRIDLDTEGAVDRPYRALASVRPETVIPVVLGYQDEVAYGLRVDLTDPVGMHALSVTAAYSPTVDNTNERLHLGLRYRHRGWRLSAAYNRANFYDLFGPKKTSRRGYLATLSHTWRLRYDTARRNLSATMGGGAFFDLNALPDNQNVVTTAGRRNSGNAYATLNYVNVRSSLGAVDNESGIKWTLGASGSTSSGDLVPQTWGTLDLGTLVPNSHLSLWAHLAAGVSGGDPQTNPYAKFYFGGFRNNWVDYQDEKRFRTLFAFPGLGIDSESARGVNFAKAQAEAILPPLRFRRFGGSVMYLKWLRPSLFATSLHTDLHSDRGHVYNAGAQVDLRLMLFSYLNTTLSFGAARAWADGDEDVEYMVSLKIL